MTTKQLATLSLICVICFAGIIFALHFLRPDLNPINRPTSEYAVGRYGIMMSTAFFSMSVATFTLLIGLYKGIPKTTRSRAGLIFLGVWGVAVLIAMLLPIDPDGTELTTTGKIHRINGPVGFLCLSLGIFLVTRSFNRDENWRSFYPLARILSWLILGMFVITGINIGTKSGFEGLCQRVFLVIMLTWFILTTLHLRSVSWKNRIHVENKIQNFSA